MLTHLCCLALLALSAVCWFAGQWGVGIALTNLALVVEMCSGWGASGDDDRRERQRRRERRAGL